MQWRTATRLAGAIESGDDGGILAWFDDHYPRCMSLIPGRRRGQFLAGGVQAWEDGEIDLGWGAARRVTAGRMAADAFVSRECTSSVARLGPTPQPQQSQETNLWAS
jgi:hypothetical protein